MFIFAYIKFKNLFEMRKFIYFITFLALFSFVAGCKENSNKKNETKIETEKDLKRMDIFSENEIYQFAIPEGKGNEKKISYRERNKNKDWKDWKELPSLEKKEIIKDLVFNVIEDYKKSGSNFKIVQEKLSTLNLIFESMKDYDNSFFIVGHILNKAVKAKNKESFESNLKDLKLNLN